MTSFIFFLDSTNARYADTNARKIKNNPFNGPQKRDYYRCLIIKRTIAKNFACKKTTLLTKLN